MEETNAPHPVALFVECLLVVTVVFIRFVLKKNK